VTALYTDALSSFTRTCRFPFVLAEWTLGAWSTSYHYLTIYTVSWLLAGVCLSVSIY